MSNDTESFEQFMKQRAEIALAYVKGDGAPIVGIATRTQPATFFGPFGGLTQGAAEIAEAYQKGAAAFGPEGENRLEILQMAADNGIAFWVGFQRATAHLKGKPDPIPMALRITEVFRREGDEWKLVHRHADTLTEEAAPAKK
jgi:ketosteroid isomerase-like protein